MQRGCFSFIDQNWMFSLIKVLGNYSLSKLTESLSLNVLLCANTSRLELDKVILIFSKKLKVPLARKEECLINNCIYKRRRAKSINLGCLPPGLHLQEASSPLPSLWLSPLPYLGYIFFSAPFLPVPIL